MRQYRDLVTGCGEGGEENNRVKEGSRFMSKPVENMNKEKVRSNEKKKKKIHI